MRTTVTLDDELMADAAVYCGITDKSKIINVALEHYIKRMAAKRLIALGGTMPDLIVPARNSHRMDDSSPAREAARALVALGGSMPDLDVPKRRRSEPVRDVPGISKVAEDTPEYGAKKPKDSDS